MMAKHAKTKRKINIRLLIAGIIALAGVGFLLYPVITTLSYKSQVSSQKQDFINKTQGSTSQGQQGSQGSNGQLPPDEEVEKPYEELYQFLKSENERMAQDGQAGLVDAFSYQVAGVDLSKHGIEDGCIGFIEIPSINVIMPIYLGANSYNMSMGAVHLTQTSYPIGGVNTNCVIAAHRGGTTDMLRNIHKLAIGDEIIITNFREVLTYRVVDYKIILPTDINEVKIQQGRDLVTLVSCNPLGSNTQRYVVYCERV